MVTQERLHILQHALGLDRYGQGNSYRSHFVTGPGTTDYPACMELVEGGLMVRRPPSALTGGGDCFIVTDTGRQYVRDNSPPPPKLTRSQRRYLDWLDAGCGLRFGEWIKLKEAAHG